MICATATQALQIPESHRRIAELTIKEILECRFENALQTAEFAYAADNKNPIGPVLHLVALGMRDVDFDSTIDAAAFLSSFERAKTIVEEYERENGVSSYSLTLKGFTMGIHASYHLKNGSYFSAAGTGNHAIKLMKEARELDPDNTDVNFFLGLYDYAKADIRKKVKIIFWFPGNKQSGIQQLEEGARSATLTKIASQLALSDIYLEQKQPEKSREIIDRLKKELPNSRFVMWAEAKYFHNQNMHSEAALAYGRLADSYGKYPHGTFNATVTRNQQAHSHARAGETEAAINACKQILERSNDKRTNSLVRDTERLLNRLLKL
jgi:tetratricopeptide (TPR) repeat protein